MLDKIEHNISQNAGLGFFITVIIGFVGLVISQPYIILLNTQLINLLRL